MTTTTFYSIIQERTVGLRRPRRKIKFLKSAAPFRTWLHFFAEFFKVNSIFLVVNPENAAPSRVKNRAARDGPPPPHSTLLHYSTFGNLGKASLSHLRFRRIRSRIRGAMQSTGHLTLDLKSLFTLDDPELWMIWNSGWSSSRRFTLDDHSPRRRHRRRFSSNQWAVFTCRHGE